MPIDPKAYKGRRIAPLPYDENNKPIPALFVPIVDPLTGEIAGYLPLRATDNGDGTATLKVDTEIAAESVTLQNIKVGSSDAQASGDKWLRVLPDGTVLVQVANLAGLATAAKQDAVLAQLDVVLSSRASETTLGQVSLRLSDIKGVLDALNAKDYATQATLTTRASESTLTGAKTDLDTLLLRTSRELELLENGKLFTSVLSRNSAAAPENMCLFVAGAAGVATLVIDVTVNVNNPLLELYLNPAVTANGTALTATNLNRSSRNTPTAVLYDAPTVTGLGTLLHGFMIGTDRTARLTLPIRLASGDRLLLRRVLTGAGNELRLVYRWGE